MWRVWFEWMEWEGKRRESSTVILYVEFLPPPPPFGCTRRVRSVTAVSFNDVLYRELRGPAKVCRSGMLAMAMYDVTGWLYTMYVLGPCG